jgi:hypothetical protein
MPTLVLTILGLAAVYLISEFIRRNRHEVPERTRPARAEPSPFAEILGHAPEPRVERWPEPSCWAELAQERSARELRTPGA